MYTCLVSGQLEDRVFAVSADCFDMILHQGMVGGVQKSAAPTMVGTTVGARVTFMSRMTQAGMQRRQKVVTFLPSPVT